MGIHTIMSNALHADWNRTDDFQFTFSNKAIPLAAMGNLQPQDLLDVCTISVATPQLSADITPTMIGGGYRLHQTKFQPFTFSAVFRDLNGMELKSYFTKIWLGQQGQYFDDIKSEIKVSVGGKILFESSECLISSVSQSDFDNNNSQVSEFTVEFLSPFFSDGFIKEFGKPGVQL